jgi:hypothetical protein
MVLAVSAALANYLPTRRAAAVDPVELCELSEWFMSVFSMGLQKVLNIAVNAG